MPLAGPESGAALSVHHVGGRSATRDFPQNTALEHDIVSVLYEADPTAIAQMESRVRSAPSRANFVYQACLGGRSGPAQLFVYSNRYATSLYQVDMGRLGYSFDQQFGWDNDPGSFEIVETPTVELVTLDEFLARPEIVAPPPDYLSLDTQGSELDILQGAAGTLGAHGVAVKAEVSFTPLYLGQPLYPDVADFLKARGFELADLKVFASEGLSRRLPIGLRGRGFAGQGEALFLRRPEVISTCSREPALDLLKLALISFLYSFHDHTYAVLDYARKAYGSQLLELVRTLRGKFVYVSLLESLLVARGQHAPVYPVSYSSVFPKELSAQRFSPDNPKIASTEHVWDAYFAGVDVRRVRSDFLALLSEDDTAFESACRKFGFTRHADEMKDRRRRQMLATVNRLQMASYPEADVLAVDWDAVADHFDRRDGGEGSGSQADTDARSAHGEEPA